MTTFIVKDLDQNNEGEFETLIEAEDRVLQLGNQSKLAKIYAISVEDGSLVEQSNWYV